jgi:Domain of unknown function (DUF4190)
MTAPGGASGESAHDDDGAHSPPTGEQRPWQPPWDSPAPPPAADYPSTPYPASGYPPGYPAGYPPPGVPPGYETPPGYGGPPAGYGPGGYYPPPDYPPPDYRGGYGPHGAYGLQGQPGMNGLAIGSLISSFTGLFCCIGGILAIVLGAVALGQIKRTHQDGYALAVAGIVIGVATMIVNLVVAIFALQR